MTQLNDVSALESKGVARSQSELAGQNLCLYLKRSVDRLGAA
jgi:hypothetical protein